MIVHSAFIKIEFLANRTRELYIIKQFLGNSATFQLKC